MAETAINFVVETLNALESSGGYLSMEDEVKDLIATLYDKLGLLRTFKKWEGGFYQNVKVKSLEIQIQDGENVVKKRIAKSSSAWTREWEGTVTYNGVIAADEIVSECKELSLNLDLLKQEIEAMETELKNIISDLGAVQIVRVSAWPQEIVVGFRDEEMAIKERLLGGQRQLQLIFIYGMAGQLETTLTKKVYNDALVRHYFYRRAWINVSQEYQKRDLLLGLLDCVGDRASEINQMSEEKLGEQLYRRLRGMKYLIVMDDVWDGRAWDDLKQYFPNDRNGSRILFTTRHEAIALAQPVSISLTLRFLGHDESWELFQLKVFQRGTCPSELMEAGMQIAKKCRGLPPAIITVAGILTNEEKRKDLWEEVEKIMNQSMIADPNVCSKIFELSYKHLPPNLFNSPNAGTVYLVGHCFPGNLIELSLHGTYLDWDEISKLGWLLPNLAGLELLAGACRGSFWGTRVEFPKLEFLIFDSLHIKRWHCSSNHFPRLWSLSLVRCAFLEKIPSEIGDIPTLRMIDVYHCNPYVANSAREIKEEQESIGNQFLQISLEPQFSRRGQLIRSGQNNLQMPH